MLKVINFCCWFFLILIGLQPIFVIAGINNGIPSCYKANHMPIPKSVMSELFVMVDQTTLLDENLKKQIMVNVDPHIIHGNSFVIGEFSSYAQGRYLNIVSSGRLEQPISEDKRYEISVRLLKNFDSCLASQLQFGRKKSAEGLKMVVSGSSSDIAKSDVISSLKEISDRVKKSTADRKIVLIVSDMLENSSISSFYSSKTVREIDPEKEMANVEKHNLFGDFGDAEVYVIGAGLLPEDSKKKNGSYRPHQVMKPLEGFWQEWFKKSNAKLIEFGQPALLNPIE